MKEVKHFPIKLLHTFCPPHLLEEIEGDLVQKFERDVKNFGERKAKRRLLWNVVRFCRLGILLRNKFSIELNKLPMFQNYFKTTYRHIFKSKINFGFKLGGLTLSLLSFLVIVLYISYQLSFDKFHEDYENIYRVNSIRVEDGKIVKYATVPPALGTALKAEFPEIKTYAGISEWGASLVRYNDKLLRLPGFVEADSTLFDVFTFHFVDGNRRALNDPNGIALSKAVAKKIFGEEDPMNKLITFPDRFDRVLEVKAIFEDWPTNSSLFVNAIMNFGAMRDPTEMPANSWEIGWGGDNLFLRMDSRAELNDFSEKVKPLLEKNLVKSEDGREKHFSLFLQPFKEIYLGEPLKWEFDRKGNPLYLYIYGSLAFFLLVIAGINYLNLSIADFDNRNKEIGVRKVLGASKRQIAFQVIIETTLFCLMSLILSLGLLYLFFPQVLQLLDSNLRFAMLADRKLLFFVAVTVSFLVIASTAYPAYRLSSNHPINDLKKKTGFGRKSSVSQFLLLVQFTISVICISSTWIIGNQLKYIKTRDVGFDRHNLVTVYMPDRYPVEKAPILKSEISKLTGVEVASFSYYHMTSTPYYNDWYKVEIDGLMKKILLNESFVDHDFFKTMDVKILAGRGFDVNNPSDMKKGFIVNESAVKAFGWKYPIGKSIAMANNTNQGLNWEGTVVGVVKDFNTRSLHKKIEPLVLRLQYDSWSGYCLNVRISGDFKETMNAIELTYKKVLPGYLMDYSLLEDRYNEQYQNETKAYTTLQAGTWIIVLISSLGIFSLSVYLSIKRMKEFGIRKVLGASRQQISFLHISHFLKIVFFANIMALPIAYWLMKEWLDGFAYRVELNNVIFLLVAGISFFLVVLAAGYSSWKAGRMNPVDVIKME